ncbi:MAG: phosphotransferase [Clostridium sp.]
MDYVVINFLAKHLNWNTKYLTKITSIGGLSNKNYKVYYYGIPYFVRLCDISIFNINRKNELSIINKVSALNICPAPIYFDTSTGDMVSSWIYGQMPTESQSNSIVFLSKLCFSLKNIHNLKYDKIFNPFNEVRNRLTHCKNLNIKLPVFISILETEIYKLEEDLSKTQILGLCHNDLNMSNIILYNEDIYIIDYEFSGTCDIFFDLATVAWLQNYDGRVNLLTSYFGYFSSKDYEKLIKYLYIVKFLNALWSIIKSTSSSSDYDYKAGANIIFDELYNSL